MSRAMFDEFFLEQNVTVRLYPESKTISFKTVEKLQEFISKEYEFWKSVHSSASSHFQQILNELQAAIQYVDSNFEHSKNQLRQAVRITTQTQWPNIYSKTSVAQFIKKQTQVSSVQVEAAIQYLIQRQLNNISNHEYFKGYLNAYLFEESSKAFNEAATTQEATLSELHSDYLNQLNDLNADYHRFTTEWKAEFDNRVTAWTESAEGFKATTTEWRESIVNDTKEELSKTLSELESIRARYTEHLRLQGPASYWKDLEKEYNEAGNKWRWWAVGTTAVFIALLTIILLVHPTSTFINNGVFDVNSLRNALIFTIITSISIYIITLFVKLSVSSYHLARDAKERYQITHVYLSLLNENENAIKDAERITVFQAIFSRSDTGLLKSDSGPTMPDSLTQILKLLKK